MSSRLTHTVRLLSVCIGVLFSFEGSTAHAQEIKIPERWSTGLLYPKPLFDEDTLTIRFLGDIMMHESQIKASETGSGHEFDSYFSLIAEDIRNADLAVANMEFTLAGEPYSGYPCFSAPDAFAGYLAKCGFDIFLAANNHIFDKGSEGAERTAERYRELGIRFTGLASGQEEEKENNPLIIRKKGISIAFMNATYGTNLGMQAPWPKTNYLSDRKNMEEAIARAEDADADYIVILPHWGTEYKLTHSEAQRNTALWLAGRGADLIIGAHPHVVQDFEMIAVEREDTTTGVPVAYSLGNAVSNMSAANTQIGLMATVRILIKANGDLCMIPPEFTYLWCSRPGGYNDSYTVIPVRKFLGRKEEWKGGWDYEKMVSTYERVKETTGIEENQLYNNEQKEHHIGGAGSDRDLWCRQ